jgi:phytoene desaturase
MMSYTELADGVWFPRGGMYQVVEALMRLARRAGVEFVFNAAVEQIEVESGGVRGVQLEGGRTLAAEAVLANADLPYVYQRLLPHDRQAKSIAHKRFSCSVVSFFWGLDRRAEGLGPHTLFLSDDFRGDFDRIERHLPPAKEPSLYLHAPSRIDPSLAPPGEDSLVAIVPVGHLDPAARQDWSEVRDLARQAIFRRLAKVGHGEVPSHIKFEVSYTPLSWKNRYNLMNGATHGLSHNLTQLAYFRPSNRHPRYRNLYFVGASTRPGTGVPTAMISARLTSARMLEEMGL